MRQNVVQAIKNAFTPEGSTFYHGFITGVSSVENMQYPCVWLIPIELTKKTGSSDGELIYKAVLYYFDRREQYTEEIKEQIWSEQERNAVDGVVELSNAENVNYVLSVKCEPNEFAFTPSMEISMQVTLEISVPYCHE